MPVEIEKKLKTYFDAALDCINFCIHEKIGICGFSNTLQLTNDVLSEFFCAIIVIAVRFAKRDEIVRFVQKTCREQFAAALQEVSGGIKAEVIWVA